MAPRKVNFVQDRFRVRPHHGGMTKIARAAFAACLSLLLSGAAFGAPPSGSAQVLAAARSAYGPLEHPGVLVETGAEHASGLDGRWRLAQDIASGRMNETSDFGVFPSAEVWNGQHHWRQDHSGGVHDLNSAFARANTVTAMWLARLGFARKDADGARIDYLGAQDDGGHSYTKLRATPRDGQPVELWFDTATGLLAKSVWEMAIDDLTIRYEDYRRIGGMPVPFKVTSEEGGSDPDIVTVDHAEFAAHPAANEFDPPRMPDDFTIAGGVATVPVSYDGDVVIEAMLNGKGPFAFILDTGGHDILTPGAIKALGLGAKGTGAAGGAGAETLTEQYTRVANVDIGGVHLRDQSFFVLPLQYNTVERGAKPPLAGIMGLELFERFAMELNYRAKTLTFRPLANAPEGHGTAVPIFFTDDQPTYMAKIDGIAGPNGLDTGNSGALVVQGIWADRVGLAPRLRQGLPTAGFGSGGMSRNWAVRTDVEVAGIAFPHIVASYSEDKKGAFSSRFEAGNIGNQIYENFTLGFDYRRGIVWFDPAPGPAPKPTPFGLAGISFFKQTADAFIVATVMPDSPAAQAGIVEGDQIVAVDGVSVKTLSGWDMRRAVRKPPGAKLTFDIVHAGKPRSVTLTLRELLP